MSQQTPDLARDVAALRAARAAHAALPGLPELARAPSHDNGYRLLGLFGSACGARRVGWKVGAASKPSQAVVGADEPFYGLLLAPDVHPSGSALTRAAFFEPGMEGEFAFRLGRDLVPTAGVELTVEAVADAIDAVLPAIEICDHRFRNWRDVSLAEIIADNAFHGALVVGAPVTGWRRFDLARHEIALAFDGKVVGQGPGALILGHPLNSVLWLARKLAQHGRHLAAGDLVAAGTCTGLHYASDVTAVGASLGPLGDVSFTFT
ncbi:MAG: fumarylacetoacetate hydrolase family protein [Reyranellaceae bacterium]